MGGCGSTMEGAGGAVKSRIYDSTRATLTMNLQKRALLTTCLKKVHKMASNSKLLVSSGLAKVREFLKLEYPVYVVKAAWIHGSIHRAQGSERGSTFVIKSKKMISTTVQRPVAR